MASLWIKDRVNVNHMDCGEPAVLKCTWVNSGHVTTVDTTAFSSDRNAESALELILNATESSQKFALKE